ncbi:MAG: hypothetical protein EXQ94_00370 [Alphaproteobacteria bacterium]|nr:hypothetical protein [Alphaproteobacteria bacterium]
MRDILRLIPESEVPRRASGLVAREPGLGRAIVTLGTYSVGVGLVGAGVAAGLEGVWAFTAVTWLSGGCVLLIGRVFHATYRATRLPSNWLLRTAPEGIYVKVRSFLNHRLPAENACVALIPKGAVTWVRSHRARRWRTAEAASETEQIVRNLLEINLAGVDLGPLRAMLEAERNRWVPGRRSGRSRFGHAPVRVVETDIVQIEWRGTSSRTMPKLKVALERLGASYRVAPAIESEIGRPSRGLGPEHEAQLTEHVERGEQIAAMTLARKLYGLDATEAKQKIDELSGRVPVKPA